MFTPHLDRLTRNWPTRKRLLISLMVANALLLSAMLAALTLLSSTTGWEDFTPSHRRWWLIGIHSVMLALALGAVTVVVMALIETIVLGRISRLRNLVEEQAANVGALGAIEAQPDDEIGRLVVALNKLSAAYRTSLQDLAHRADELTTLNRIAETINRTLDLQEIFDSSLRGALRAVGWDAGAIYMWDERTNALNLVSYVGLDEDFLREVILYELGEGITGQAALGRETVIVEDIREHPQFSHRYRPEMPISQVSIPLMTMPGQMVGVLNVNSLDRQRISSEELNLLITVAYQIAGAIDKGQLYLRANRHAIELERIVDARTKQLAQVIDELLVAVERAKETDKLKSLLLSTISHELRTPLATIKGNTSMLREHYRQIPPHTLAEHLRDIEEETDKLTDLISNLLEMSRIEAGILQILPQPIDLTAILRSAVNAAQIRVGDHPIELVLPEQLPLCFADARRIEQIVANLLDNAAKYSPAGSPISVRAESRDEELVVSVQDRGPGIPSEHLDRIFDRFYQVEASRDSGRHGIGLGLAICRGLVEAQGGGIWVESQLGQGSTFSFSLPVATGETLAEERWHEKDHYSHH